MSSPQRVRFCSISLLVALAAPAWSSSAHAQQGSKPSSAAYGVPQTGELPPPSPARPLGETLTGQAKQDYEAAVLLYQAGDFPSAVRHFLSAHEASGDVRLLWNAAACEQGLRHYAKAIVLVRQYLDSRSPLITPAAEQNALAFLEAARPLTARLFIEANEPGASVYVDGELVGKLPLDPDTRVDFGTHRVVLKKPNFTDSSKEVTVTSPTDLRLTFAMTPAVHQGRLIVRAGKGDSIALDGRFVGLTTFDGAVPSGKHVLRVTATGARPFETRVTIDDDRTRAVDVTLQRTPEVSGVPTWVWIVGGAAVVAGASTAGYFILKGPDETTEDAPPGSMGNVALPLRFGR
jgi:hypothetical protein